MSHILHVFTTFAVGGAQVRSTTLINHLGERYQHTIAAMDGRFDCRELLSSSAHVRFVKVPLHDGSLWSRLGVLRRWLRDCAPNLLMTYNWGTIEVALACRGLQQVRSIHHEDGFGADEAVRQKLRRVLMRRFALRGADAVFVASRALGRIAQSDWRVPADRIAYIPNGIDCEAFLAPPVTDALPGFTPQPDMPVVGSLAVLRPEKNLSRLIRAFAKAPACRTARLVIVGDGPMRERLRAVAEEHRVSERVHLPGYVPNPARYLGLFDVFALSSDTEQTPISVIEAMATGLPVVSTDVGDVRDMVSPNNAPLVVSSGDETAFAAALDRLVSHTDLRQRLGRENQHRAQSSFSLAAMVESHEALIARVIGDEPAPAVESAAAQ
jgi:glycosyltransferase involved in cell wall biosynthesis